ncbi:MAG TPA: superoxide dismutase family protein [Pseudobdellovibrionaceae bacterium]|nr:superoxide dismutase family protein [Pseudobdellovibrionaceae bacterium]
MKATQMILSGAVLAFGLSAGAANETVTIQMMDAQGKNMGTAVLTELSKGVQIELDLKGLTPGEKAFHIHEKGDCQAPKFTSAGPHLNPDGHKHGHVEGGPHAGDMSNITVATDGTAKVKVVNESVSLTKKDRGFLRGPQGAALVVHAKADDYKSQPAGDAGDRLLCGVISAAAAPAPTVAPTPAPVKAKAKK